jgi:hypothetical protein
MLRPETVPDDLLVVVRATPADREVAIATIADDAEESARIYVVAEADTIVILHGVSVFAHRNDVDVADVLRRFPFAPAYVAATVGRLRAGGFAVFPTGANVDHFDLQLVPARTVDDGPADRPSLVAAARRVLETPVNPGRILPTLAPRRSHDRTRHEPLVCAPGE